MKFTTTNSKLEILLSSYGEILHYAADGVTLKTPVPEGGVASARACGQKACLDSNLGQLEMLP